MILAFRLLDGEKLNADERKLALAVANDLKFDSMKSALKRIFTKPPSSENIAMKQEEASMGTLGQSMSPWTT